MNARLKMVTTGKGDEGITSLYSGERCPKDAVAFEILGDVDELTCAIGVIRASFPAKQKNIKGDLLHIQQRLLHFSSQVATKSDSPLLMQTIELIRKEDVTWLETREETLLEFVKIEPVFVLPGETLLPAQIDLARAVCRRAERTLMRFISTPEDDEDGDEVHRHDLTFCQSYINRLSDYLFVVARFVEQNEV